MSESLIQTLAKKLASEDAIDAWLASLTDLEAIRLRYDWSSWARPEQLMPSTDWLSKGFLGGRGMGKTRPCAEFVIEALEAGESKLMGMCAQNEERTWEVMVEGESGLIACAPPWFRPTPRENELEWPNGAKTIIYTPESPRALFGPQHDLFWASEIHAWARTTGIESWNNLKLGLRLGKARLIWDSNPKPRCPILLGLLAKHRKNPTVHLLTTGSTRDNEANLNRRVVKEWYEELGGTTLGRIMLDGDMLEDVDGALWRNADIRIVEPPTAFERVVIGVDPAITANKRSDLTGIVVVGLLGGIAYVLEDLSGRYEWEAWGTLVVQAYQRWRASKIVVERNRGGDACISNLRLAAKSDGLATIAADEKSFWHQPGCIRVLDVSSATSKASRAQPAVAAYQRGLVAHCGAFEGLEEEMLGWDGDGESPNRLDALVFAVCDILGMAMETRATKLDDVATAAASMRALRLRAGSARIL